MKRDKHHFYAAFGNQLVNLAPTRRGVEIELTTLGPDGERAMTAEISRESFAQLLTDGPDLLEAVDLIRDDAMRKRGYPL